MYPIPPRTLGLTRRQQGELGLDKLPIIGGKDCEGVTRTPGHGESFKIGEGIAVKALHTPCHTQDSICWFMQDGDQKVVFTGDTLFISGGFPLLLSFCFYSWAPFLLPSWTLVRLSFITREKMLSRRRGCISEEEGA